MAVAPRMYAARDRELWSFQVIINCNVFALEPGKKVKPYHLLEILLNTSAHIVMNEYTNYLDGSDVVTWNILGPHCASQETIARVREFLYRPRLPKNAKHLLDLQGPEQYRHCTRPEQPAAADIFMMHLLSLMNEFVSGFQLRSIGREKNVHTLQLEMFSGGVFHGNLEILEYLYPNDWKCVKDELQALRVPESVNKVSHPLNGVPEMDVLDVVYKRDGYLSGSDLVANLTMADGIKPQMENRGYFTGVQPVGLNVTLREDQLQTLQFMFDREVKTSGRTPFSLQEYLYAPVDNGVMYSPYTGQIVTEPKILTYGGFLADEVGFGKTVEILSLILKNPAPPVSTAKATLVVCTVTLVDQWVEEVNDKLTRPLRILKYYGSKRKKEDINSYDIVVTTYQTLAKEFCSMNYTCTNVPWWRIVLDESHVLGDKDSNVGRACIEGLKAVNRWCVTGTPHGVDCTVYLPSQLDFLGVRFSNTKQYKTTISFLRTIMIRHTREQTLKSTGKPLLTLPTLARLKVTGKLSYESQKVHDERIRPNTQRMAHGSSITTWNTILHFAEEWLSIAKVSLFLQWFREESRKCSESFKVVVFTSHDKALDELRKPHGIRVCEVSGKMTLARRTREVKTFTETNEHTIMALSIRAASTGLNLMAASHVVFLEATLSQKDRTQAIGRISRMGQKHDPIFAVDIRVVGTLDDAFFETHESDGARRKIDRIRHYCTTGIVLSHVTT